MINWMDDLRDLIVTDATDLSALSCGSSIVSLGVRWQVHCTNHYTINKISLHFIYFAKIPSLKNAVAMWQAKTFISLSLLFWIFISQAELHQCKCFTQVFHHKVDSQVSICDELQVSTWLRFFIFIYSFFNSQNIIF